MRLSEILTSDPVGEAVGKQLAHTLLTGVQTLGRTIFKNVSKIQVKYL